MIDELIKLGADNPEISSECLTIIQHLKNQKPEQQVHMLIRDNVIFKISLVKRSPKVPQGAWLTVESEDVYIPCKKWVDLEYIINKISMDIPKDLIFLENKCDTLKFKVKNK